MTPIGFKPNLAGKVTRPDLLRFPQYVSPKLDGIRATVWDGVALSRSLKSIPNKHVQDWARSNQDMLNGLDGELIVGANNDPNAMQKAMAVMRKDGCPDFTFNVFDAVEIDGHAGDIAPFSERHGWLMDLLQPGCNLSRTKLVRQYAVYDITAFDRHEELFLSQGYEGMMTRSLDGRYKFGRSTEKEGGLLKVKRSEDAEAIVIGYQEEMFNANEAKANELGRTERSTQQAGLIGKGTLGALLVRSAVGVVFSIGTGFTAGQRASFWLQREDLIGRLVTYKFFNHGIVAAPRHPVFKSFRHEDDQ